MILFSKQLYFENIVSRYYQIMNIYSYIKYKRNRFAYRVIEKIIILIIFLYFLYSNHQII